MTLVLLCDNNFNRTSASRNEVPNFPLQLSVLDLMSRNQVNNSTLIIEMRIIIIKVNIGALN